MKKYTASFVFEKETKNTIRFTEKVQPGKPPVMGTVYVQKWVVGDAKEIEVDLVINGNG